MLLRSIALDICFEVIITRFKYLTNWGGGYARKRAKILI